MNLWKIFAGHTGDWFDVKTASICTTELWDAVKSFVLNGLKIRLAVCPIIVSLGTLSTSCCQISTACVPLHSFSLLLQIEAWCNAGYQYYQGSCYKLYNVGKDFDGADSTCKHDGGYLVQIQSSDENNFVAGLYPFKEVNDLWIGATDREIEGTWRYTRNNQVLDYSNWGDGYLDNARGRQHCALMHRYHGLKTWDDRDCGHKKLYVCEKGEPWNVRAKVDFLFFSNIVEGIVIER